MLELKKGKDILEGVGGAKDIAAAQVIFNDKIDSENKSKLEKITNEEALIKIANAISVCQPDNVFINTGSAEDVQWIRDYSLRQGEEKKLARDGHTIHFDLPKIKHGLLNKPSISLTKVKT